MSDEKKQNSLRVLHTQMQDVELALFEFLEKKDSKDQKKAGKNFRKTMKFLKRGISSAYQESLDIEKGKNPTPSMDDFDSGAKVCLASEPAEGPQGEPAVIVELEVTETAISAGEPELAASAPAEVAVEAEPVAPTPEPESVQEPFIEPAPVDAAPASANDTTLPAADLAVEALAPVAEPPVEPLPAADPVQATAAEGGEAA